MRRDDERGVHGKKMGVGDAIGWVWMRLDGNEWMCLNGTGYGAGRVGWQGKGGGMRWKGVGRDGRMRCDGMGWGVVGGDWKEGDGLR